MKRIALLLGLLALALVEPAHAVSNDPVYSSSHTATTDTSASLGVTRALLYKIVVSSAGTGSALVTVKDGNGTTLTVIDATAQRDQTFEAVVSSGLVYTTAGTLLPQVSFLYSRSLAGSAGNLSSPYSIFHSTGVYTTRAIRSGRVFLKRVIIGKAGTAPSAVTIYNSNGTSTGPIIDLLNAEAYRSQDYNVILSNGLTYTATGNPNVTFIYGNTR